MPTTTRTPTTVGHPYRDRITGLVPEAEAYDPDWADEDGFGDGISVTGITAETSAYSQTLHLVAWIRPDEHQAPRDSIGRPMTSCLAQGATKISNLESPSARGEAIEFFTGLGITEEYAGQRVDAALGDRTDMMLREARINDLVDALTASPKTALVALEELHADAADPTRVAVRFLFDTALGAHPGDRDALVRRLNAEERGGR